MGSEMCIRDSIYAIYTWSDHFSGPKDCSQWDQTCPTVQTEDGSDDWDKETYFGGAIPGHLYSEPDLMEYKVILLLSSVPNN